MVLVSAGDFYGTGDVFNAPKSHFIAEAMGVLGYDAVAVGDMDLGYGLDTLVADMKRYGLPVTCANLVVRGSRESVAEDTREGRRALAAARRHGTVFPPYRIVLRGGVRFGIVALISPDTRVRSASTADTLNALTWAIEDPEAWARRIVPEVRRHCDVVLLLAHMDLGVAERIARNVEGIDVVVVGHQIRSAPIGEPRRVGHTVVLRATSRGQNIGVATLRLDRRGRLRDVRNRIHHLGADYPDDPDMARRVARFEEVNRRQQKVLYARAQLRAARNTGEGRYVGLGACADCHADAFDVYTRTAHARAFRSIAAGFHQRDGNCIGCHVTGWRDRGGYAGIRLRGAPIDLVDVQCEACHGPGAEHSRDGRYAERAREACVRCHTPDEDPDFDFERDWPKVEH